MASPILIVMAGLPGTGKTTLAKLLVRELSAAYLRTDPIAGALLRGRLTDEAPEAGRVAYLVAESVALENLKGGVSVVVDGVNASHERRAIWPTVAREAAVPLSMFETTLRDPREHRRRLDARAAGPRGHVEATWESVATMSYDPWDAGVYGERSVVDMTDSASSLSVALDAINAARAHNPGG